MIHNILNFLLKWVQTQSIYRLQLNSMFFNCTDMSQNDINSKYIEYLNEALSAENAAVDRITSRIDETPLPQIKQRYQQHLEETRAQQDRLSQIITQLGEEPTDSKANLPELKPPSTMMLKKTIKDTIKSVTDDKKDNPLPEEMEFLKIKQDVTIEGSEIVSYEALIEVTKRIPNLNSDQIIPLLKQSLEEEMNMKKWCTENMPMVVDNLLPKILSAVSK
jgi:ferritin-like metal-binding protein YciE